MNALLLAVVPALYKWVMVAILRTCKVRSTGKEHFLDLEKTGQPWLMCSWHNNTAITVCLMRNRKIAMMASASRDGELIARGIAKAGNTPVRGSSSFRGPQAARAMVRALRAGANGAMTPDGPRGPAYRCQPGVLWIAALAGCPIVPYEINAVRQWRTPTWDRHKIPKCFTTLHEYVGEPIYVTREQLAEGEPELLARLQERMLDNTRACLRASGHPEDAQAL
ncbi:MAG: lysophospholipid acyltransferase family protein [Arenicellales bacterium]